MAKANSDNRSTRPKRAAYGFHLENGLRQASRIPAAYAVLREATRLSSSKTPK